MAYDADRSLMDGGAGLDLDPSVAAVVRRHRPVMMREVAAVAGVPVSAVS